MCVAPPLGHKHPRRATHMIMRGRTGNFFSESVKILCIAVTMYYQHIGEALNLFTKNLEKIIAIKYKDQSILGPSIPRTAPHHSKAQQN